MIYPPNITCTLCIVEVFTVLIVTITEFAVVLTVALCDVTLAASAHTVSFSLALRPVIFLALSSQ